ncbi:DNA topoisomerase 2 [Trichophyton interdigitale MR816]|uniref:DNA topoisomerase 2 n=2 Tax=Trichophyton TaxID=5550 RepID=A0A059J1J2_TRIIM|nr:DNA topoisomerase 2 [Trichophyton interdigitale H6]KDB21690.1 DNA topoisomerase 2 [Trichophyton interdigitale MR816]
MSSESDFENDGFSSDFAPKPKAKAAPKKAAAAAKPKDAPKKLTQTTLKSKTTSKATSSKKVARPDPEDELDLVAEEEDSDDADALDSTPPNASKKQKAAPKKAASKPLANVENGSFTAETVEGGGSSEKYQKITQLEHILKRPDTYIGSVERTEKHMWVYNSTTELMEYREVSFVPGLYKIFDEILVNAADNKQNDPNMSEIRVTLDKEAGEISVWNNGRGIPVEIHKKEQIYIPELIFGHLLTSSNYNDMQEKVTGGRNGYGAKLCNIFSNEFTVETADSKQKKKFKLTWTNNMSTMGKAKITECKGDDYTKVTFKPDFAKFGMDGMDDDFEALVKRRVYDMAGTCGTAVKLNGTRIPIKSFKKYMEMYTKAIKAERGEDPTSASDKNDIITESPDRRWEIGFTVSDGSFQQVSFVNSIATTSGGTHVNYISDQICNKLADALKKKNKTGATLKAAQIKNHIFLFVNSQIVNPAFTSQTKEQLTTRASQFGSKCVVSDDFLKKVMKTRVMDDILHFAEKKADQILKKTDGNRRSRMNNPKLTDANKAGTKDGHHCTLILTEGDSAKGLAMAGRAVVGPDLFGVFPLRGKLLNVRDASVDQISKNAEIQNIKNFIGLQHKKEYTDTRGLRYGHLMIMTDQDHDGSHIKGLLINYLQVAFPTLLKIPGFLIEFITPIVKVWKGNPKNPTHTKSFFTLPEYEEWKEAHAHDKKWQKKYYKGLGTSSTEDAQIYFQDLDRHLKQFHTLQDKEAELIELAFSKKKADERKEWLRQFKPGTYLDHSTDQITYTDFINKELILFSMADNIRSIPSVVDGLKPGQRKVLYTMFKRNVRKDVKVVELAGYVSGMTAYQHGDNSLHTTIVGLAQTFVGSNNINCLEPSGNFGSRLQGGSDSASARYIYTRLSPFARRLFHQADEPLLVNNIDDGKVIEPETYVPVVPLILINGADGIGTGWSTSIPNYNPEEVVDNLKRLMAGEELVPMKPWFRGFKGEVTGSGDRYKFSGIIKQTADNEVEITELPIRTWTQDFKDKLEEIIKAEKVPSFIKDYKDYNTHTDVHFIIQMEEKHMKKALEEGLEEKFKLVKQIATSNMVAFDAEGRITRYETPEDILRAFYAVRIKLYEKRKQYLLSELQTQLDKLSNQARFVQMIIDGKLVISKKKKAVLIQELQEKGFKPFPKVVGTPEPGEAGDVEEEEDEEEETTTAAASSDAYDYLLSMPLWSLTQERVDKLRRQIGDKEMEVDALIKLSKEDLWRKDLDEFISEWRFQLEDEENRRKKIASRGRRLSAKVKTGSRATAAKKRKAGSGDDSDFDVPKVKKAAVNRVQPKGGLLDFLSKAKPKPKATSRVDGADDSDDFEDEVMPKPKSRGAAKEAKAKPAPVPKRLSDADFMDIDSMGTDNPKREPSPVEKPKVVDDDSDIEMIPKPTTQRSARNKQQPKKYHGFSTSEDEEDDDFDVSAMVKGIDKKKPNTVSTGPTLFSEPSRPAGGSSKLPAKPAKETMEFDADETDYSKLIPQNSPRRSLLVKPKESKVFSDAEDDIEDEPKPAAKPTAKAKASSSSKSTSKPAAKASTTSARGRPKKAVAAAPEKEKKTLQLSPAAKVYASKKAKAKKIVDDMSDDDIDAMANDILDSEPEEAVKPSSRARPSRRAATAAKRPVYALDDDSSEEDGDAAVSSEDFSD